MNFAQVSKIRLEGKPYDAEVEYLESADGFDSYIDTGIAVTSTIGFDLKCRFLAAGKTVLRGNASGAAWADTLALYTGSNDPVGCILWHPAGAGNVYNTATSVVGSDVVCSLNGTTITLDGSSKSNVARTSNIDANVTAVRAGTRVYYLKITDNGVLVRDYIPVRKNGVGYLFDKVSGQLFGNVGTDAFIYGSDVRCYSVAKIEKGTLPGKPYDHRVEYIESSGTQWIDTGVLPAGATILIDSVVRSDFATTQVIVGCGGGGGNWFGNVNGYYGVATNKTCGSSSIRSLIRVEYLSGLIQATNVTTGETCQMPTGTLADRNIGLFASSVPSYFANVRIFSARILVSGTIVRDFIPIRKNGVGCLYDQVSKTLFQNAGTGTFTYGSDVPEVLWKKRPYDAEVEWLESTGTQYIDTGLNYFPEYEIGAVVPGAVANNTLGIDQSWKLGRHSAAEPVWRASIDNVSYPTTVSCGTYADMSYHGTTFRCNSDTLTVPPNQYAEGSMVLFSTGVALPSAYPLKLYYCRLFDQNGILVRDFIPVRLGQVGYLYDKVTGQLFGNAGTGSFVYGADLG